MQKTIKELKSHARGSLLGNYKIVITALIFSQFIVLLINIPFNRITEQGIAYMVPSRIMLGMAGTIIVSLLASLLDVGVSRIHLQIARRQETGFHNILYAFQNRPDKFLGYSALILVFSLICVLPGTILAMISAVMVSSFSSSAVLALALSGGILCVVGAIILIIFLLAWALTPYLLLDQPELQVLAAMKQSRCMMQGSKGRLFRLLLSFLGWIIFSILTFGLGLLWIIPYMTQTFAWFYLGFLPENPPEKEK